MKAFEEWYQNEPEDFHLETQHQLMERAWKAALEEALKHETDTTSYSIHPIRDWIRKEFEK